MALLLQIIYGSTTVDLASTSSTGIICDGYSPRSPDENKGSITDRIEFLIKANTKADLQTYIQSVETALRIATERRDTRAGTRVYLKLQPDGYADAWTSEIFSGRMELDDGVFGAGQWPSTAARGIVVVERAKFWEGTEAQVPLTNGNGTDNTSGLNVYNCNDGSGTSPSKRHNYAQIAAASVSGNLPAPVRLEMTNNHNSTSRLSSLWIGHNHSSDPANFQHFIEGEAATYGGSNSAGSGYSGGYARYASWSDSIQSQRMRWQLDSTFLARANGRWFKILAPFLSSAGTKFQWKITFPSGTPLTVVSTSQEVTYQTSTFLDSGTLQIPPWLPDVSDLTPVDLTLYARRSGGSSVLLDYIQVIPLDSYRVLIPRGYGAAYQVRVVDDGFTETVWTDGWSGGGKTGHYTTLGNPIMLYPGRLQRLYFSQQGDTGDTNIDRVLSVKLYYKPRRSTV